MELTTGCVCLGRSSWLEEYKRLCYNTPTVCSEVLVDHDHQVLHVSFAHNGSMFATSSKDGYIIVNVISYYRRANIETVLPK